jgi:hypothetical protein
LVPVLRVLFFAVLRLLAAVPPLFFAAVDPVFFAAAFFAVERADVDRVDFAFAEERVDDDAAGASSSIGHLPDITFCAASATASAISDPSLVALVIIDLAAFSVVSAASIPASLIARRALGLAAIAAAAAARPAASISLLMAALASLSIVSFDFDEPEEEDLELDVRLLDFAIANLRFDFAH